MRKIVTLFGLLAILAIVFSCKKEADYVQENTDPAVVEDGTGEDNGVSKLWANGYLTAFGATTEAPLANTKVDIDLATNALAFEDGDQVLVYSTSTGKTGKYVYNAAEGVKAFEPASDQDVLSIGDKVAYVYYPYAEFALEEGVVKFTMPEAVGAGSTEDLGNKLPLVAVIPVEERAKEIPNVTFKHLGSILRVCLKSAAEDGETVTAVTLAAGEGSALLTGSAAVSWSDAGTAQGTPVLAALDGGNASVTVGYADGKHLSSAQAQEFYFFLPQAGTLSDLALTIVYGKTDGINSYSPSVKVSRNAALELDRAKMITVEGTLAGHFSGGDGSKEHPYLISNADDFKVMAALASDVENAENAYFASALVHYKQTADIAFAQEGMANISPVGYYYSSTNNHPFKGEYDGGGFTLSNLKIERAAESANGDANGIFPYVSGGVIKNLSVSGATVEGNDSVGILAGRADGASSLTGLSTDNCIVEGSNAVSGLVAHISGSSIVRQCSVSNVKIILSNTEGSTPNNQGGIIGYSATSGEISNCTTSGTLVFDETVEKTGTNRGGIIGRLNGTGKFQNNTNNFESLTTRMNMVGGLIGLVDKAADISACYNNCSVKGGYNVGGIVGQKSSGNIYSFVANNASVEGVYNVGGLVGLQSGGNLHGNLANGATALVINTGAVTATGKDGNSYTCAGGVIGRMTGGSLGSTTTDTNHRAANTGNVTNNGGGKATGGIVGLLTGGTVKRNRSNATIISNHESVGGAIGHMTGGTVAACYAKGNVKGLGQVGGFVGFFQGDDAYIVNCAAGANVIATVKDNTNGVGGFVGYMKNNADGKYAQIGNCAVWDVVVKAPNQTAVANKVRVGGFVGVQNFQNTRGNSVIQNCYYQGSADHFGYGGGDDWTSLPTINIGAENTVIGGFAGYSAAFMLDCYTTAGPFKSSGSGGTYTNNTILTQDFMLSATGTNPAITTSDGTAIAENTSTFGSVLGAVSKTFGEIAFSGWSSYEEGGKTNYFPSALEPLGEEYYKK